MVKQELKDIIAAVGSDQDKKEKDLEDFVQLLVFEIDQEEYAIPITHSREIIKIPEITSIPHAPDFIRGILNLRGQIVVVVDLERRFSLVREKKAEPKHIIVTKVKGNVFGVIVDEVKEVLRVPKSSIQKTPELVTTKIKDDYLQGVVVFDPAETFRKEQKADVVPLRQAERSTTEARLIILLDIIKLLEQKELLKLGESIQKSGKNKLSLKDK